MGLFNFLAVGNSLRGLVGRRFNYASGADSMIPNFGLRPGAADRLREVRENRRREDPFTRRDEAMDREIRQRLHQHSGPRVRSTYQPERPVVQRVAAETPSVATRSVTTTAEAAPPATGNGAGWVRKLKIARRVTNRPSGNGRRVKRQPKRPSVHRGQAAARRQRAPQWMAGT